MKRIIALFVAVLTLAGALASCGEPADPLESLEPTADETTAAQDSGAPETDEPTVSEEPEFPDEPSEYAGLTANADGSYTVRFENGYSFDFDTAAVRAAYDVAAEGGFVGSLTGWIALSITKLEDELYRNSEMGVVSFSKALKAILESYGKYFYVGGLMKNYSIEVNEAVGYLAQNGVAYPNSATQTYRYTQRLAVSEGQTLQLLCNGQALSMRFVAAFANGTAVPEKALIDEGCTTKSYTVPKGVTEIAATFRAVEGTVMAQVSGDGNVMPELTTKVDYELLLELSGKEIILPPAQLAGATSLLKDGYLTLAENHVMHNKSMRVVFNTEGLGENDMIVIGHGEKSYGGSAVEITKDKVRVYYYSSAREDRLDANHGIEVKGIIEVEIKVGFGKATVSIENDSDKYVSGSVGWGGRNGTIFVKSVGATLKDVVAEWRGTDYEKEIWIMGDSYFNTQDPNRWPYYLYEDGHTDYFMMGFPGRNTQQGLEDFKRALEFGTPKYAVWCLGMNNGDSETGVNANWKNATDEFLRICQEKGITPILTTTPNTPTVINSFKNEYVKSLGYRYIDFAEAVGASEKGAPWYTGMLAGDKVHPAAPGAKALYEQIKKDFPEILG